MTHTEKGWAISGPQDRGGRFLFVGWWATRKEAIADHTTDIGWTWAECRRDGDRAVKVTITWEE